MKALDLDEARWPPRQVQGFINARKDEGQRAQHLDDAGDPYLRNMLKVYAEYQASCERGGLVDFAELLLRAHELWRERPDILHHYRSRFRHILVDEFQDTNTIQYAWLRLLSGEQDNLFLVGDDDQSIYGWRGARVENIQNFQQNYPKTRLLRLEQNYRSTANILSAANALIAHNPSRLGKNLWTEDGEGELIRLDAAFNEVDEARFVVERIRQHIADGHRRAEAAILYRTTAQSRLFEEALLQAQIPYRVYGGLRFFERAEIKDALAYLRLVVNPADDAALERVVNTPTRGIGARTLDAVRSHARSLGCSLWQAVADLLAGGALPARAAGALRRFVELIEDLRAATEGQDLAASASLVITGAGLAEHYQKAKDGKGVDRIENLEELVNATRQFNYESEDDEVADLSAFLAHAALEAGEAQGDAFGDCVQLMTLHSAKGLEFPLVFIAGMEEKLFPHSMSADDPDRLAEERRLCYVGMTRAMRQLYLSYAESRRLHGSENYPLPSRFLREIPGRFFEEIRSAAGFSQPRFETGDGPAPDTDGYTLGQRVRHPKFGEGVVLNSEGRGASARIQVNFEAVGSKWLVIAYANLQPV